MTSYLSNHEPESSLATSKTNEFVQRASNATVESLNATKPTEIPFSSRFVDYKNRLSYVRSEDDTSSTTVTPASEARRQGSRKMNDSSLTSMDDRSNRDRRGSFQMMNDYLVKSLRDCSEFHDSSIEASDYGPSRTNDRGNPIKGRTGRFATRRGMTDDSEVNGGDNSMIDRSVQSTHSCSLDESAKSNRSISFLGRWKGDHRNGHLDTSSRTSMRDHSDPGYYGHSDNRGSTSSRRPKDP